MARRIYKWPLEVGKSLVVPWSPDDVVLLVAEQRGTLTVWAEQEDSGQRHAPRQFTVCGTGFMVPPDREHIGSAVCGEFVWHVYAEPVVTDDEAAV